ncbi:MAG: hypothetical protein ACKO96_48915, partial [Flammeovirgaceae bacterium]
LNKINNSKMEKNQNNKGNSVGNNNINSEILISENCGDEMTLKIQTLDNIFPIVVKKTATVNDLKEKICEVNILFQVDNEYPYSKAEINIPR